MAGHELNCKRIILVMETVWIIDSSLFGSLAASRLGEKWFIKKP